MLWFCVAPLIAQSGISNHLLPTLKGFAGQVYERVWKSWQNYLPKFTPWLRFEVSLQSHSDSFFKPVWLWSQLRDQGPAHTLPQGITIMAKGAPTFHLIPKYFLWSSSIKATTHQCKSSWFTNCCTRKLCCQGAAAVQRYLSKFGSWCKLLKRPSLPMCVVSSTGIQPQLTAAPGAVGIGRATITKYPQLPGLSSADYLDPKLAWFEFQGNNALVMSKAVLLHPQLLAYTIPRNKSQLLALRTLGLSQPKVARMVRH